MKVVIDIPDNEVPKRREIVEIGLQFFKGEVCECTYPFQVLPKGYGRLIDADALLEHSDGGDWNGVYYDPEYVKTRYIYKAPTIIEADKETNNE